MKTKLMEKIQKLLALAADNPDSPESQSAAEKAAKMMAENNIGYEDIDAKGNMSSDGIEELQISANMQKQQAWEAELSSVLCSVFDCQRLVQVMGKDRQRIFVGAKSDVKMLAWLYKYVRLQIARTAEVKFKLQRDQTEFGLSAVRSLSPRLREMYEKKKEMDIKISSALVVAGKEIAVNNYFNQKYPRLTKKSYSRRQSGSHAAASAGYSFGQTLSIHQQVQ